MRRLVRFDLALLVIVVAVAWWLTRPITISADELPEHTADPVAGERMFWAGGCASCHASPVEGKRARGDALCGVSSWALRYRTIAASGSVSKLRLFT